MYHNFMTKQVIAYLHTHWDREWYREFEIFRMRLLRVFDNILNLLENCIIPSFYFDGQVSALEDYLEMRPEKEELVRKLIQEKKLFIGPFYCLVDEFLTDKTCFSKNLEIGLKIAHKYGCEDFIGYLADTFGHSQNVTEILHEYGIDKCIVWRGCGDIPAEFKWCGTDTVNLIRGYFNDIFCQNIDIAAKAKFLKKELDLIAEKSSEYILLPLGGDHLGINECITEEIKQINQILQDEYEITLGSPFDYFNKVQDKFNNFVWNDELRDNSKTFTLQGCYSSRLDLKRLNIECTYKLDLASKFAKQQGTKKYDTLIDWGYKLLIQNQAHDSICGCSIDDVHRENEIRYKKILQIANGIIDELKFENHFEEKKVINLSYKCFSGVIEFETSTVQEGYEKLSTRKGFESELLANTLRVPITEDYKTLYTYMAEVDEIEPNEVEYIMPVVKESDLCVKENFIGNSKINLRIEDGQIFINGINFSLINYADLGDSYNFGPDKNDDGKTFNILRTRILMNTSLRVSLRIDFEGAWDIIPLIVSLNRGDAFFKFDFDWENTRKNHLLCAVFCLNNPIHEVFSEDMNKLIKRKFAPEYNIRKYLPKTRGLEAKNNTAPMQRGLLIDEEGNNIGIVTKGLTQYEVSDNRICVPLLRATGQISNPYNPARTTPAGPPLEVIDLQMLKRCKAEFYVFFGNENAFEDVLNKVYSYIIT